MGAIQSRRVSNAADSESAVKRSTAGFFSAGGVITGLFFAFDLLVDGKLNWGRDAARWLKTSPAFEGPAPPLAKPEPALRSYDAIGRVTRVFDGDTIQVRINGDDIRVRLHGIDSPEKEQDYGRIASNRLRRLIAGEDVGLEIKDTDDYGRTVAVVYKDGVNVNLEMVRLGHAWWYRRYARFDGKLRRAEREAREARRGLWSDEDPQAPWEWRRSNDQRRHR